MSRLLDKLPQLRLLANQAMWESWHAARLHRGTPNEVACIKNLIEVALPLVEKRWSDPLRKVGVKAQLQGVVCHGHPWVKYAGASARCELGDFLLVHDHQPDHRPLKRRAAIVQAKVFHRAGVRARNSVQLDLYQRWPRFTYDSWPGGIANLDSVHARAGLTAPLPLRRERELTIMGTAGNSPAPPIMLDQGCRYGMIDVKHSRWGDPRNGMNPWRLCSAQQRDVYTSKDGMTLGGYLVWLMAGKVGRRAPITKWPSSLNLACHWSLMVIELLSILPGAPVSSGPTAFLATTPNLNLETAGNLQRSSFPDDKMDDGAFGIILVRTSGDIGDPSSDEDDLER